MTKNYREELPELDKVPDDVYSIYIIPYAPYNGFWGENGFMSFDFVFGNGNGKELGWVHWEGDVINIFNNVHEVALSIDSPVNCGYLRLYSTRKLDIGDLFISSTTIKATAPTLTTDEQLTIHEKIDEIVASAIKFKYDEKEKAMLQEIIKEQQKQIEDLKWEMSHND